MLPPIKAPQTLEGDTDMEDQDTERRGSPVGETIQVDEKAERNISVRQEEEEYAPEWAAAKCIAMSFDGRARTAMVACLQPIRVVVVAGEEGEERARGEEFVNRECVVPW